jgi:hypothetical protein
MNLSKVEPTNQTLIGNQFGFLYAKAVAKTHFVFPLLKCMFLSIVGKGKKPTSIKCIHG